MKLLIFSPHKAPRIVPLTGSEWHLGRAEENDCSFPEDAMLSRRHLCFRSGGNDTWFVRDCGSRNGTTLNHGPLTGEMELHAGDHLGAGHLTIEIAPIENSGSSKPALDDPGPNEHALPTVQTTLREVLESPAKSSVTSKRIVDTLIGAGRALSTHQSLEQLFETILDLALDAVRSRRGVLMTNEDGVLRVRASRSVVHGADFTLSRTVRDAVLHGKQSLIIRDIADSEAFRSQDSIIAQNVRSMVAVPLQTGSDVLGLLYVDNGTDPGGYTRSDLDLLTVMANIAAIRLEHARLALIEEQDRLLQAELEGAADIQRQLLPFSLQAPSGYELSAEQVPCRAVGGDYYDLLHHADHRFALLVADVCGKGLPAALMMASLQARVQMLAETEPEPAQALRLLNKSLAPRFPPSRFITVIYAMLQPETGRLWYANAGHNLPIIIRKNGQSERLEGGSLVLALLPNTHYDNYEAYLNEGDLLCLFSDGIPETASAESGEHYGEDRLAAYLALHRAAPLDGILANLQGELRTWSQSPSADDVTIVLLRRLEGTRERSETLLQ